MIFVTNAAGKAIYLGTEWTDLTGQTLAEAVDYGWVRVVHPEDQAVVRSVVAEAIRREEPFSVRYRLLHPAGHHIWVLGGAVPSFGPPGRCFLGFLGSISRVPDPDEARAGGTIGSFDPPQDLAVETTLSSLETAADHLIAAHALLDRPGAAHLLTGLRTVLYQVGLELAKSDGADGSEQVH